MSSTVLTSWGLIILHNMGYVFLLKAGEYFKIEATELSVNERYEQLQDGNPYKMKIIAIYQGENYKDYAEDYIKVLTKWGLHFTNNWFSFEILPSLNQFLKEDNFIIL